MVLIFADQADGRAKPHAHDHEWHRAGQDDPALVEPFLGEGHQLGLTRCVSCAHGERGGQLPLYFRRKDLKPQRLPCPCTLLAQPAFDGTFGLWTGLATHYVPHDMLADIKARIHDHPDRIAGILSEPVGTPPKARIEANADKIAKHFASDAYEDILASLEAAADAGDDWAMKERDTLGTKSPQTCKVALRQLAESLKCADFAANMAMEYRIASRVLTLPDFAEGVRAVIVDKDNAPKWDPATPEGVTDDLLDAIFAPLGADDEWKPL